MIYDVQKIYVMKKIFSFLLLLPCIISSAQNTFQKAFGGSADETGTCIQNTLDGNYIISGYTTSFSAPFRDAYLIKTDTAGNNLWFKTYDGSHDEVWHYLRLSHTDG